MDADTKISLSIDLHEYKFLANTLSEHKGLLHRLGINDVLKKELLKDVHIIATILGKSEEKPKGEINGNSQLDNK